MPKIGIIGVGHIATSLIKGCHRAGWRDSDILLSPRGGGPRMAEAYGFALAKDNRAIVEVSDIVVVAVRPRDVDAAIEGLPWRSDQILLSACAGVPIAQLVARSGGADVVRFMPITAAELGESPTIVFPHRAALDPFLSAIGRVIAVESEGQFETATVSAAVYGWVQMLIGEGQAWSVQAGLEPDQARRLMAQTFIAAGKMVDETEVPVTELISRLATPGGITELGLHHLDSAAVPQAFRDACSVVHNRLTRSG